ncbi:MAG TPA: AAA family ATPase [Candidatus Limnocylindrales bacterium]|nr:AAA family ATPase [Candidatus Limnocylindrales bacterium]
MRVRFAGLELDDHRCELSRDGIPIAVEPRVFDLLSYLIRHRDRVVMKDELLDRLWPDRDVQEGALSICVHRARRLIEERDGPPMILTVARRGYRFSGPVEVTRRRAAGTWSGDPFVGREREFGDLQAIVDALSSTNLRTAEVTGEEGVGKSALLEEIGTYARRRRMEVLRAAPAPGATNSLYSLWAQVVAAYVTRYDSRSVRLAMGRHLGSLASIVPFLGRWAEPESIDDTDAFHDSLLEAVAISMRAAAADRPVLLLFDDVERADTGSLSLLRRLLPICASAPVLIAVGWSAMTPQLAVVLDAMREREGHRRFELTDLDRPATQRLLDNLSGSPVADHVVDEVMRATGGRPARIEKWWRSESLLRDRNGSTAT